MLTGESARYETVYNQPIYSAVVGKLEFIEEAIKNQAPPKAKDDKPKQEKAPKAAAKPKAKVRVIITLHQCLPPRIYLVRIFPLQGTKLIQYYYRRLTKTKRRRISQLRSQNILLRLYPRRPLRLTTGNGNTRTRKHAKWHCLGSGKISTRKSTRCGSVTINTMTS